jgi:hypothetical protein
MKDPTMKEMIDSGNDNYDFTGSWSSTDVSLFCSSIQRFGDNLRKVWLLFDNSKTFKEVLDFYHRMYPYTQRIGVKGFISIYRRADNAKAGFPDEVVDENNESLTEAMELEQVQQQSYLKINNSKTSDDEYDDESRPKGKKRKANDGPSPNNNFIASDNHFGTLQRKKKPGRPKQKPTADITNNVEEPDEVLCICHIMRTDDRYICCTVGDPNHCNGWVHLECVGLDDYPDDELQAMSTYICPSCQADQK